MSFLNPPCLYMQLPWLTHILHHIKHFFLIACSDYTVVKSELKETFEGHYFCCSLSAWISSTVCPVDDDCVTVWTTLPSMPPRASSYIPSSRTCPTVAGQLWPLRSSSLLGQVASLICSWETTFSPGRLISLSQTIDVWIYYAVPWWGTRLAVLRKVRLP